jgi:transcriptional regulator with XRE-family HTH domain
VTQKPLAAHRVIATRVKELRKRRGWSAQRLGEEMAAVGVPWDRSIVANFENGRRSYVTVEELLALAYVLSVAPVHLVVPLEDSTPYAPVPSLQFTTAGVVRAWIRGQRTIGDTDPRLFYSEVPPEEFVPLAPLPPPPGLAEASRPLPSDEEKE